MNGSRAIGRRRSFGPLSAAKAGVRRGVLGSDHRCELTAS